MRRQSFQALAIMPSIQFRLLPGDRTRETIVNDDGLSLGIDVGIGGQGIVFG